MKVIKSVILTFIIGGLTIAAGDHIKGEDTIVVNGDEQSDDVESRAVGGNNLLATQISK